MKKTHILSPGSDKMKQNVLVIKHRDAEKLDKDMSNLAERFHNGQHPVSDTYLQGTIYNNMLRNRTASRKIHSTDN